MIASARAFSCAGALVLLSLPYGGHGGGAQAQGTGGFSRLDEPDQSPVWLGGLAEDTHAELRRLNRDNPRLFAHQEVQAQLARILDPNSTTREERAGAMRIIDNIASFNGGSGSANNSIAFALQWLEFAGRYLPLVPSSRPDEAAPPPAPVYTPAQPPSALPNGTPPAPPAMNYDAPAVQSLLHDNPVVASQILGTQASFNGDYQRAMSFLVTAVEGGARDGATLTYAALSAYNTGDMRRAADWAAMSINSDPAGTYARQAQAILKLAQPKLDGAPKLGQAEPEDSAPDVPPAKPPRPGAAAKEPSSEDLADRKDQEARAAIRAKDYERTLRSATSALKADPDDVAALNLRAAALIRLHRYKEAYEDAAHGLKLAPGYVPLLLAHAIAAGRLGRFEQVRLDALEVLRKFPKNAAALRLLAFGEAGLGHREAMLAVLTRAAVGDPNAAQILRRAHDLPADGDAALLFSDSLLLGDAQPREAAPTAPQDQSIPKAALAVAAAVLSAAVAAGLLLLRGRKERQTPVPPPTDRIGPFRLLGTLGAGGMGVVYKAVDLSLDRPVALKRMREEIAADPRERERFLKEARIVSGLDHPGIVRIHSIHEGPEGTFLVFEYVEGQTLSQVIGERGRFSLQEARAVLSQCADAVSYAHSRGVVHRDLKPSNIMLDTRGRVRVMDFGVARAAKDALTRLTVQGTIAGTPPYMSPEQEEGHTTPACDVYALGVCLYEMLTGRLPYQASGAALVMAKHAGRVPPLSAALGPEAPAGVDGVLARALAADPRDRFASARDFAAALGAVPV